MLGDEFIASSARYITSKYSSFSAAAQDHSLDGAPAVIRDHNIVRTKPAKLTDFAFPATATERP